MKKRYIVIGGLGGLFAIGMMASEPRESSGLKPGTTAIVSNSTTNSASTTAAASTPAPAPAPALPVDPLDNLTTPQKNAARSAEQYLSMQGFSRRGLIEQLSSNAGDGYAKADATIAVDSLEVDWNENAARSAEQYLKMMGFSCKGLIEQLSSSAGDQYTVQQATYGAKQAGAC